MLICSGAVYDSDPGHLGGLTVNNNSILDVSLGGTVYRAIVSNESRLTLSKVTESTGVLLAVANSTTVSNAGQMFVNADGFANETRVSDSSSELIVNAGGTASTVHLTHEGTLSVNDGGVAGTIDASAAAIVNVNAGGRASAVTGSTSAVINVNQGGTVFSASVGGSAILNVNAGVASTVTVGNDGTVNVNAGATLYQAMVTGQSSSVLNIQGTGPEAMAYVEGATINTRGDTVYVNQYAALSGATVWNNGKVYVSGGTLSDSTIGNTAYIDITSGSTIDNLTVVGGATFHIGEDQTDITIKSITIDRTTSSSPITWSIASALDLSDTVISIIDNTIAVKDTDATYAYFKRNENIDLFGKTVYVNGEPVVVDAESAGYRAGYDKKNGYTLKVTWAAKIPKIIGNIVDDGLRRYVEYEEGVTNTCLASQTRTVVGFLDKYHLNTLKYGGEANPGHPNKILTANNDKGILGCGIGNGTVSGTCVQATLFSNGHFIWLQDINWDGYFCGGANNVLYAKNSITIRNDTQVKYGIGGGILSSTGTPAGDTSVTVGANANSESVMLSGGNYVTATNTVTGNSTLTIEENSGISVSGGYAIGGSAVTAGTYTFNGVSTVSMASGTVKYLVGSGYLNTATASYDHEGTSGKSGKEAVKLSMTGGTVTTAVYGGICNGVTMSTGTKTINGNISMDSTRQRTSSISIPCTAAAAAREP